MVFEGTESGWHPTCHTCMLMNDEWLSMTYWNTCWGNLLWGVTSIVVKSCLSMWHEFVWETTFKWILHWSFVNLCGSGVFYCIGQYFGTIQLDSDESYLNGIWSLLHSIKIIIAIMGEGLTSQLSEQMNKSQIYTTYDLTWFSFSILKENKSHLNTRVVLFIVPSDIIPGLLTHRK